MAEKTSEIRKQVEVAIAFSKDPLRFLQKNAEQHEHLSRFKVGPVKYIHVFEPDLIKHILQTNYLNYTKDPENHIFKTIMGNGLLMNDSPSWVQERKLLQPLLQPKYAVFYSEQITKCTNEMLLRWANKKSIDIYSEMNELSFDIISSALVGCNIKNRSENIRQVIEEITSCLFYSTQTVLKNTIEANEKKLFENKKKLNTLLFEIIIERKNSPKSNEDLLSLLLQAKYENGTKMSDDLIRDELTTLLFAGADTTASALTFLFYELAQQPEIKETLQDELRNKRENNQTKKSLSIYVIHETLRLYPPGWLISRIASGDDMIGDVSIKKGDTILISPFVMHRSKRFWNNPEQFNPLRFESFDKMVKYSFIPFSTGPKTCVGNNLAISTMQTVLELTINKFDVALTKKEELEFEAGLTLRPKNKLTLQLRPN